jgi:virulence-associated protein VapD
MYAIAFDMIISDLKNNYGEIYNNAYYEIKTTIDWFRNSVRDIRAFRIEDWSDFTSVIKGNN